MSLQFIFGNSGSGKSDYLYEHVLAKAAGHPNQNFLILVPEQFTMQTQRELVMRDETHAIMNVEVLSFARLAYRVFDELGRQELVILEETGKNLVLRRVAEEKKGELSVLGGNMNRMGYIGEVKSFLSELTQYNITPEDLERFLQDESVGEALRLKLSDILVMYRGFRDYMEGKYITSEEVLSLLCEVAGESDILKGSVIVFDEFTGFTPIQNRLMREFLVIADRVMVSVSMDTREDFYHSRGVHELFAMSKKTVAVLLKIAEGSSVPVEEPIILEPGEKKRYRNAPELFFMEQNLFRPSYRRWQGKAEHISVTELRSPREELIFVAREITRLVREKGYRYRDFAVVTGDVPQYASYVPEIFEQYAIPCFIDQTRNILFHPFLEFIRAALEVVENDFSYQSIFRFLRSGLSGIEEADIDRLENYVLARGIRGRKRWSEPWTFVISQGGAQEDAAEGEMLRLNAIREQAAEMFAPLFEAFRSGHTVAQQTYALYQFIASFDVESKLAAKEEEFEAYAKQNRADRTSAARAQEYAQIYKIVMDLLDKVAALLGEEELSIREYGEILDAGFDAAKVGIIPPGNDRVTIGDIERTRLNHVKVLFFVGVNDGVVPKAGNTGSIISQFEREKMAEHHLELAPGAREKVFIQKFYLYLNMTKPSDALYVTFSRVDANGKALRRSYLIGTLLHMFPELSVTVQGERTAACDILTPKSAMQFFLEGLNDKRAGNGQEFDREEEALWEALLNWYLSSADFAGEAKRLLDAAYRIHTSEPIGHAVTRALYGTTLENSVTRLERFAACAFAHYLQYGLKLSERRLQEFASVDMGNIYHEALEHFAERVRSSEYTWFDLPENVRAQWIEESMEDAIAGAKNAGVFDDARNRYLLLRMKETLRKTVWALTVQVQKGKFVPEDFEVSFSRADDLKAIHFALSDEEKMRLTGRIDRIDTYETDDKVYVKVIDYKSGNTSFSLLNLYHGLQLQLVVYLNAALELMEKRHPGKTAEAAGIFYYHIENPMVDGTGAESEEEIRQAVLAQLKLNGLVNEQQEVYRAMDTEFSGSSAVIPVAEKTDGSLKATSKTASGEDFLVMSEYVRKTIGDAGRRMMDGDVAIQPYELSDHTGCDYCPYHMVCGFDPRLSGFSYRKLEKFDSEDAILARMREEK
ncbi:MAG: helicase-exonuclease AddAB subunit AddB [Roseburia sp.]|nr:helicase-exonuclease AddAB subunit AddB [Roseburia sp.]